MDFIDEKLKILNKLKELLNCSDLEIISKVENMIFDNKKLEDKFNTHETSNNKKLFDELLLKIDQDKDLNIVIERIDNISDLRQFGDLFREKINKKGILVIGSLSNDKPNVMSAVTDDLFDKIDAIEIVKYVGKIIDGGGGGKPGLATAGGKDKGKLDKSLTEVKRIIEGKLNNEK